MAVDALLIKCTAPASGLAVDVANVAREIDVRRASVTTHAALDGPDVYAYLWMDAPIASSTAREIAEALAACSRNASPCTVLTVRRLKELAGASANDAAPFHYVVEAGVEAVDEEDFNAWYDTEHLPGLAAVPGCVRARRLCTLGARPTYIACYDLVAPDALKSEAWLAVRRTPWSSRVRPTFRDTKRTMFRTTARTTLERASRAAPAANAS